MAFESAVRLSATERVQQRAVKSNSSSMELIVSAASPLSLPGERRQQAIPSIAQKRVSVATRHSAAMPIKRSDVQLGARYAEAVVAFNKTQQELARLEAAKGLIFDSMSQETQQSQVEIPPKYWHAEAALEWIGQGTVKESRTVARAVRLLKNGEFPGKYFDIKVEIAITHALAFGRRAVKPTPRKPPNRRQRTPATASGSDGWQTDSGDESPDPEHKELNEKLSKKIKGLVAKRSKAATPGRFNGRVHATAADGPCGPDSLICALRHLSQTRGYNFVIPNDALALREALVNYIEENQHVEGDVEGMTLAQEIQLEYFPVRQSDGEKR
jgi:hypothetical protein